MVTPDEDSRREAIQEFLVFVSNPEHRHSPQAMRSSQALEKLITDTTESSPVESGSDYSFAPWPDEALEAAHKSARQAQPRLKVDLDDTQVVQARRRGNVLEVPVSINENDAIWMGVDTGLSTDFLIDHRFAEQWEFTRMSEPIEKQTDTHLTKHSQARLAVSLRSRDV